MEAASIPWRPIGELFIARGLITEDQLEQALAEQVATGRRLGEILVARDLISSPELTQVLMEQLGEEVAKEDGFGSGLWSAVQRRVGRSDAPPAVAPAGDSDRPALQVVDSAFGELPPTPSNAQAETEGLDDSTAAELEADLEELRSELGVVPPPSPPPLVEAWTTEGTRQQAEQLLDRAPEWDARVVELETKLQERSARIEELESALAAIEMQRDASAERLAGLEAADAALSGEREAHEQTRQRLQETQADETSAREAFRELERGLDAIRAEREAVRSELDQARATIATLEERLEELGGAHAATDAALIDERHAHAQARQQSELAATEADQAREELRAAAAELEAARSESSSVRKELEQARAAVCEVEHDRERAREELTAARNASNELSQRLAAAEGRAMELAGQVSDVTDRLTVAESTLADERVAHESTRRQAEHASRELENAKAKAGAEEERHAELAAAAARVEISTVEARLADEAANHARTRQVLAQALEELTGSGADDDNRFDQDGHICFAPGPEGYRLVSRAGRPPSVGSPYDLDDVEHVVTGVGASPLPFDRRRCVYLQTVT